MTKDEILRIKEHIEIHARREPHAVKITEIMWKAVAELEHLAELEKENAELKAKIYGGGYEAVITKKDADIILLEHLLEEQKELHKSVCDQLTHTHRNLNNQLTKAKEIIKKLMEFAEMDDREYEEEYKEAEQFLNSEVGK